MANRPKLGSKFAAPTTARPTSLAGLLDSPESPPPPPNTRSKPSSAEGVGATSQRSHSAPSARPPAEPRPQLRKQNTSRPLNPEPSAAAPTEVGNKVVPVVLDASVHSELRTFAARTEQTLGGVALRAIEAHADDLQIHWATAHAGAAGRLFDTSTQQRRRRRSEPGVQTQLRISVRDATTLDLLAGEWGAPSRSALVNEALRRYVMSSLN